MALAIGFNTFAGLQRDVPGYTSALQNKVEGSQKIRQQLGCLTGSGASSLAKCNSTATTLIECGPAPNFAGITTWLNTPGGATIDDQRTARQGRPGRLLDLLVHQLPAGPSPRGSVVQPLREGRPGGRRRAHPRVLFRARGLQRAIGRSRASGSTIPVAVDDSYDTWNAYANEYWPADYLIDASGNVRHVAFGEGGYSDTESLIRQLLTVAHPGFGATACHQPPGRNAHGGDEPETYVGYDRLAVSRPQLGRR